MKIDLGRLRSSPNVTGNNIYGTILYMDSYDEDGQKLCCVSSDWTKGRDCGPWEGDVAEWVGKLNSGKKGIPNVVRKGDTLYVVKSTTSDRFSKHRNTDFFNLKSLKSMILKKENYANACLTSATMDNQYIGLDSFANEILINSIITDILEENFKTNIAVVHFDTYSICGKHGLIQMPYAKYGDLYGFSKTIDDKDLKAFKSSPRGDARGIRPEILKGFLVSIAQSLRHLQEKAGFIHGDLKVRNVLIFPDGNNGYIAKMSDFGNSSVTITSTSKQFPKPIRLFNEYRITRFIPKLPGYKISESNTYDTKTCVQVGEPSPTNGEYQMTCKSSKWWELPSSFNLPNNLITAHSGLPFYKAYDFYTLMISLMAVPIYYNTVMNDVKLKSVWDSLWRPHAIESINKAISNKKYNTQVMGLGDALNILEGRTMRCNAIDIALDLLK